MKSPNRPPEWVLTEIIESLAYRPDTGELFWIKPGRARQRNRPAGSKHNQGYRQISFSHNLTKISLLAHHVCWFLYYYEWPDCEIDHRDTKRSNNRIKNLRLATSQQNKQNRGVRKDSASGHKGIHLRKDTNRYWVRVIVDGNTISVGNFDDLNEAIKARDAAYLRHHGEFSRY